MSIELPVDEIVIGDDIKKDIQIINEIQVGDEILFGHKWNPELIHTYHKESMLSKLISKVKVIKIEKVNEITYKLELSNEKNMYLTSLKYNIMHKINYEFYDIVFSRNQYNKCRKTSVDENYIYNYQKVLEKLNTPIKVEEVKRASFCIIS